MTTKPDNSSAAAQQPTRIPMGGVDKCLLCRWQGRPDEPHGCPRYMDSAATPSWITDWIMCRTCGRWFHPQAKICGNYCKDAR